MALTVGTDTYATLAEANAYAGTLTFCPAEWTGAQDTAKEAALKQAALVLDTLSWRGQRATYAQVMAWPRVGVEDADGYSVDGTTPAALKTAQAELAVRLIAEDRTADAGALVPDTLKVGSLQIDRLKHSMLPPLVLALVRPFLRSSGGMVGGVRG